MSTVQESSTVAHQQTKSPHEVESNTQMDAETLESVQKGGSASHTEQSGNSSNSVQDAKKNATNNEEKNLKVKDDVASSPPAVSQASSANGENFNQKNRSPRDYHQSSQNWRKNDQKGSQNRQPKNKKREEIKVEPLTDVTVWPSLDQVAKPAEPNPLTPKKEGSDGKSPKDLPSSLSADKKKAINWIPFKDALPASTTPSSQTSNSQSEGSGQGSSNQDRRNRGPRNMQNQRRRYDRENNQQQGQQGGRNQNWRNNGNNQFRNRNRFPNRGQYPQAYPMAYPMYEGEQLQEVLLRQM